MMQITLQVATYYADSLTRILKKEVIPCLQELSSGPAALGAPKALPLISDHLEKSITAQMEEEGFHFFITSALGWKVCDEADLGKTLEDQRRLDTKGSGFTVPECVVFRVPGPKTREYSIEDYTPQVPGVTHIARIKY